MILITQTLHFPGSILTVRLTFLLEKMEKPFHHLHRLIILSTQVLLSDNNLFVSGNGYDQNGFSVGLIAKYLLDPVSSITCPVNQTVNTDPNLCSAKVYGIDPASTSANITYTLTGATTASGTGSASGLIFNKGITTVTYALSSDATQSCSFTVTVLDKQPPVIENLIATPASLWPPDHKLKPVTLSVCCSRQLRNY